MVSTDAKIIKRKNKDKDTDKDENAGSDNKNFLYITKIPSWSKMKCSDTLSEGLFENMAMKVSKRLFAIFWQVQIAQII